jgi:hypothetical protein
MGKGRSIMSNANSNSHSHIGGMAASHNSGSKAQLPDAMSQQLGSLVSDANRDAQQSILNNLKGVKLSQDE